MDPFRQHTITFGSRNLGTLVPGQEGEGSVYWNPFSKLESRTKKWTSVPTIVEVVTLRRLNFLGHPLFGMYHVRTLSL